MYNMKKKKKKKNYIDDERKKLGMMFKWCLKFAITFKKLKG